MFQAQAFALDQERADYLKQTYSYFLGGLLVSSLATVLTLTNQVLASVVSGGWLVAIILMFGSIFWAQATARSGNTRMALLSFYVATFIMGMFVAPAVGFSIAREGGLWVVNQALFTTTLTFGALTAYVFITGKNFSFMGGFLVMGLVAVIGASLLNLFLQTSALSLAISAAAALLFSGFILYDTSRILHHWRQIPPTMAALSLFLDFINLFLALLRIFSGNRD